MELEQRADQFTDTVFLCALAVSKAALKPHQQSGDSGTTEPRAFLQDVSSLYPCCMSFLALSKFLIVSFLSLFLSKDLSCIELQHWQCFSDLFCHSVDGMKS